MKKIWLLPLLATFVFAIPAGQQRYLNAPQQQKQLEGESSVVFKSAPENNYWMPKGDKDEFFFYVFLDGKKFEQQERLPFNLSMVIDRSGSMQGEKIRYTKEALNYVINTLEKRDMLSIVQYDDKVQVLCPPQRVVDKNALKEKVNNIQVGGATNLSGGMEKGYELVTGMRNKKTASANQYIHRVILLSDGRANQGVTDPVALRGIASKQFNSNGVSLSTFGVGADYNENLMASLADQGGANYQFIGSPDQLPDIFGTELNDMVSIVAKNTVLEIDYPEKLVTLEKVYMYPHKEGSGKVDIFLNDMFTGQQKAILIKFKVKKNIKKNMEFVSALKYNNTVNNFEDVLETHNTTVSLTNDKALFESAFNPIAGMGHALMVGGEKFEAAMAAADKRKFKDAETLLREAMNIMEAHFERVEPHPFLQDVYNDMKAYERELDELKNIKDEKTYRLRQKSAKHRAYKNRARAKF